MASVRKKRKTTPPGEPSNDVVATTTHTGLHGCRNDVVTTARRRLDTLVRTAERNPAIPKRDKESRSHLVTRQQAQALRYDTILPAICC